MAEYITKAQLKSLFPKRKIDANKGDFGKIALIGGSVQYSGSIRLAEMANAAMRSGVGLCTVAVPKSITNIIAPSILESTLQPLGEIEGSLLFKSEEFESLMEKHSVIAFGMGLGISVEVRRALEFILEEYDGTLIVDADGLNVMAQVKREFIAKHKCKLILTPHPKEFARLSKKSVDDILADPEESAKELAKEFNAIVLLKGHNTYVTDGEKCYRVTGGGPGMATAGSGDVLDGVLSAIVANNQDNLLVATAGAAYINAIAGAIAETENGAVSQIASDTVRCIQATINRISGVKPIAVGIRSFHIVRSLIIFIIAAALGIAGTLFGLHKTGVINIKELFSHAAEEEILEAAEDYVVTMEFVPKDIYIDGVLVNNYELYRPFARMDGRIYVPLTEDICSALGINASWEGHHTKEILIEQTEASGKGAFYDKFGWNLADVTGWAKSNVTVKITGEGTNETIRPEEGQIISYNDGEVFYIPISLLSNSKASGISAFYDNMTGLYISTDADIPAEKYMSLENLSYITARAEYINSFLTDYTLGDCAAYEYIFRHEANVRDLDEDLLLMVCRTESKFNKDAVSSAGALGLMQFMPNTAKSNNVPIEDLFKVHESIQFGARYLSDAINNYDGDLIKVLAAYNHGGGAVMQGNYTEEYANLVLKRLDDMQKDFASKGYPNKFLDKIECTK